MPTGVPHLGKSPNLESPPNSGWFPTPHPNCRIWHHPGLLKSLIETQMRPTGQAMRKLSPLASRSTRKFLKKIEFKFSPPPPHRGQGWGPWVTHTFLCFPLHLKKNRATRLTIGREIPRWCQKNHQNLLRRNSEFSFAGVPYPLSVKSDLLLKRI